MKIPKYLRQNPIQISPKSNEKSIVNEQLIEPIIGHLKSGHRLNRNYLKGIIGDRINVLLAAADMNFKRVMNLWKKEAKFWWQLIYNVIVNIYWNFIAQKSKFTF